MKQTNNSKLYNNKNSLPSIKKRKEKKKIL